jgi:Predicted transcriptional regulators
MSNVAKNIRKIRKAKGITQDALAEQLHVTRQAVSNWETGKNQPDLDMLESISGALGIEMTELIYGTKGPENYPRFQRRYVIWTAVLGALVLLAVLDALFLKPWIKKGAGYSYRFELTMINEWILLPIGCIAAGMLIWAVISMWRSVKPAPQMRLWLRIAAFVLLIPAFCFAIDAIVWGIIYLKTKDMAEISISVNIPVIDRITFFFRDNTGFGLRLACTYLPFLSGLCLYPAFAVRSGKEG